MSSLPWNGSPQAQLTLPGGCTANRCTEQCVNTTYTSVHGPRGWLTHAAPAECETIYRQMYTYFTGQQASSNSIYCVHMYVQ